MTRLVRSAALGLLVLVAVGASDAGRARAQRPGLPVFVGACYCRAEGDLRCTGNLTEQECRRRCDEALCDEWFWKERLPCWNWGYGG
jgi:hypothetical protein